MAKKKQDRRVPQVPRSMVGNTPAATPASAVETPVRTVQVVESPVAASSMAEEYAHVKSDLTRIAIFSSLIFAGMIAIKLATGL